jgi:hypothetical protein
MNREQISRGTCVVSPPNLSTQLLKAFLWVFLLFVWISLPNSSATAFQQPGCFDRCQQRLSVCLQGAQGDPMLEAQCQDSYDSCGEACMMQP